MAVLHDYACLAHGALGEMWEPKCPHGCSKAFVRIVFNKSATIKHNSTKVADASIRALAADFGLTDVKNDKAGGSVMDAMRRGRSFGDHGEPQDERAMGFAPSWSSIPHAAPGWSQTPDAKVPVVNPQHTIGAKVAGENAIENLKIPTPRPLIDPKHVYRPTTLPEAPE